MRAEQVAAIVVGVLGLVACYEQHGPEVGGESHFLSACDSTCSGDLDCLSGVCTLACASDTTCSPFVRGATCLELGVAVGTCGLECASHQDCAALGSGFGCESGECRPVAVEVALTDEPLVMLVVDTSGSMERLVECDSCPECVKCQPECALGQRNRWAQALEALTGTWQDFGCERLDRIEENGATYDVGYPLFHHRPYDGPQWSDGILDRYGERVRFGMATFDAWDTYFGFPPLIPVVEFSAAISGGRNGLWSYGPEDGRVGRIHYPNCVTDFRMDSGLRAPGADEGALTAALGAGVLARLNRVIDFKLRGTRPYGGTPIAASLDDLRHYFSTDLEVAAVPVERRHVILITDGLPDSDYRQYGCHCTHNDPNGDEASYCGPFQQITTDPVAMKCPYPTAQNAARHLVGASSEASFDNGPLVPSERLVASLSVVGFAIDDPTVRDELDAIAHAAGDEGARFAMGGPALRVELGAILDSILSGSRSP